MKNKLLDRVARTLSVEPPYSDTLDGYLDEILPEIRRWSEDLREDKYYLEKPWMELRDDVHFHKAVLHFFNDGGEYLRSEDGNVTSGAWRYLPKSNKLLIEHGAGAELFDLAFLGEQFFILDKHGDQTRLGQPKYRMLVFEPVAKKLTWRDAALLLHDTYRNQNYMTWVLIALLIIAIIMALSL